MRRLFFSPLPLLVLESEEEVTVSVRQDILCQEMALRVRRRGKGPRRQVANAEILEGMRRREAR